MIVNLLGGLANMTSLFLWFPQASMTWKYRNDPKALKGISIGTQILVMINTSSWCIYGILIQNLWLSVGTVVILPLAVFTIILFIKSNKKGGLNGSEN